MTATRGRLRRRRRREPELRAGLLATTGHAEVVEVTFDDERCRTSSCSRSSGPSTTRPRSNRQGPDVGDQYRSVIFVHDAEQRAAAEASRGAGAERSSAGRSRRRSRTRRRSGRPRTTTSSTSRSAASASCTARHGDLRRTTRRGHEVDRRGATCRHAALDRRGAGDPSEPIDSMRPECARGEREGRGARTYTANGTQKRVLAWGRSAEPPVLGAKQVAFRRLLGRIRQVQDAVLEDVRSRAAAPTTARRSRRVPRARRPTARTGRCSVAAQAGRTTASAWAHGALSRPSSTAVQLQSCRSVSAPCESGERSRAPPHRARDHLTDQRCG